MESSSLLCEIKGKLYRLKPGYVTTAAAHLDVSVHLPFTVQVEQTLEDTRHSLLSSD